MKRIPTKEFSNNRDELVLQIRWLLNEMDYAKLLIKEGNYIEALEVLSKEVDDNVWHSIK